MQGIGGQGRAGEGILASPSPSVSASLNNACDSAELSTCPISAMASRSSAAEMKPSPSLSGAAHTGGEFEHCRHIRGEGSSHICFPFPHVTA